MCGVILVLHYKETICRELDLTEGDYKYNLEEFNITMIKTTIYCILSRIIRYRKIY